MRLADSAPEALRRRELLRLMDMHRDRPATGRQRLGSLRRFLDQRCWTG
jgi:hypothetical protein